MAGAEAFLKTVKPARLKDATGAEQYLSKDEELLKRGALTFADNCARCHSSKRPPAGTTGEAAQAWYRQAVRQSDFLENNFLSSDERISVSEVGTNIMRAMATNAIQDHVWQEFSSQSYKELPAAAKLTDLYNPIRPRKPINYQPPAGGRGYYRVPTLAGVWATAPLLHNNALGMFNADPTVSGRIAAFNDAMEKLLWPEKRQSGLLRKIAWCRCRAVTT
jgi:hypothetical protein